ncbi:MAG TPA: GAF domain-containing protein, partial [Anaerolineales bacterium]|nr:GAF domain-containing protein [Anaerolineales bacterium]
MAAGLEVGLGLVVISLILIVPVLVVVAMRRLPQGSPSSPDEVVPFVVPDTQHSNEAILIIQVGGRVEFMNSLARLWFGLQPGEPADLERLVRRARPAEELLNLFVVPGQKRLSVGGRLVEATSYQVPGPYPLMFVLMRNVELTTSLDEAGSQSSILQIVSDFGRQVSASLDLEETLHSILLNVSQLVPADLVEIKVFDETAQSSTIFTLETTGSSRLVLPAHSQFGELTQAVLDSRRPLLIPDTGSPPLPIPGWKPGAAVQSYLGIPLTADDQRIGTLEVGHMTAGALGQHDLDLLQLVSAQIAYSIRNGIRYTREQNRSIQLSGLSNLAQAFDPRVEHAELIRRLIETIAPLFSVEVLGFLLYDENTRSLQGQMPFQGLPEHIVAIYKTGIDVNGSSEKLLQEQNPIITQNAADDRHWKDLGLQTFAQAASLR